MLLNFKKTKADKVKVDDKLSWHRRF